MLSHILKGNQIRLQLRVKDWEEAVRLGGQLLLEAGYVEEQYIEAMVSTIKELGPYIVIAPGIAMPHARAENGVKATGMSLITLAEGVCFGHHIFDPVSIVVSICAIDHSSHLQALAQLSEFLSNQEAMEKLLATQELAAVTNIIDQYSKE